MDWTVYTGNLDWLPTRTIFLTIHGSRAYGTNTPESDTDLRGVCIAPKNYYTGCLHVFDQAEQHEPDLTIFEIRKFLRLASDANPNVIEILFTDPSDHYVRTPLGEKLLENKGLFLSKRIKSTFSGYAVSQLGRIKRHYRWLTSPPVGAPSRSEFELPERTLIPADQLAAATAAIQKKLDSWSVDFLSHLDPGVRIEVVNKMTEQLAEVGVAMDDNAWRGAARTIGYDENFIELLDRERRYTARHREWEQFLNWKKTRNPKRAEIEAKFGYDAKHAYHLVRLMRMCREILSTGEVLVRRPDAEELLTIRNGAWSYEQLIEFTEREDVSLKEAMRNSKLPNEPDRHKIDQLCQELVELSW